MKPNYGDNSGSAMPNIQKETNTKAKTILKHLFFQQEYSTQVTLNWTVGHVLVLEIINAKAIQLLEISKL